MASHWAPLPLPSQDDGDLRDRIAALRTPGRGTGWLAVHILYSQCKCSQRVFEHLFESARPVAFDEVVLLVGDHPGYEQQSRAAGFSVTVVAPERLATDYHVESAPLLLVVDANGVIRYAGGYTDRKQGYYVRDLEILDALSRGDDVSRLPLYGCGVSRELQELLDPLGIKYRDRDNLK